MAKVAPEELGVSPLVQDAIEENMAAWAEATYDNRTGQMRRFDEWRQEQGYDLAEMEPHEITEFFRLLNREGYASGTIAGYFNSVRILFNELEFFGVRDEHPFEVIDKSKYVSGKERKHDELEQSYLEKEEVMELADNVPAPRVRNELLIKLMFQTGMRRSEVSEVKFSHIDRDAHTIRVRNRKKPNPDPGEKYRPVVYYPERDGLGNLMRLWENSRRKAISKYASESDYLFVSERAPKLPSDRIGRIILEAAENAGLQEVLYKDQRGDERKAITAHSLRHSHAVYALKSGIDVRTLQEHMGHASIDQTEKYLRIVSDDVEQTFRQRWGIRTSG